MKHETTKTRLSLLLTVLLLFSLGTANAETYNLRDYKSHGDWASTELYLGTTRYFRAINATAYSDTNLSVDYYPQDCSNPSFNARIEMDEIFSKTQDLNLLPTDIRVDRQAIQNGLTSISTERGDSGLYFSFLVPDMPQLLKEMRAGTTLRFRIQREDTEPMFLEFGLDGSMAALNRVASMCREAATGPEEYFEDKSSEPDRESDPEKYF